VNAQQFLEIIRNGKKIQKEDFSELVKLHKTFPYFQIPKILLAKYEYAKTEGNAQEFLHWAAITSPDRAWLKSFVQSDSTLETILSRLDEIEGFSEKRGILEMETSGTEKDEDDTDENLVPDPKTNSDPQNNAGILKKLGEDLHHHKNPNELTSPLSKKDSIIKPSRQKRAESNDLIESIKKKAKKEIPDEKKKEQLDLIKAFSKREFKMATLKELENQQNQVNLSESSTQLNPNLVSEPYAKLLLDQGKKQKAKTIYRNLMVKFPDKRSYFAELLKAIEDKV
jgi:hypothetical protein